MPKLRVLIVDDAVVVRRILTDALGAEPDLEVFSAANGRIAISKIAQINPDVITLDMEMPEMDGLATLRELRKTHPKLPVIMFSTLTERGAAATLDALSAGANDYVTKPANVGSVAVAISRVKAELIPKIKGLCRWQEPPKAAQHRVAPCSAGRASVHSMPAGSRNGSIDIVTLGVSTGGPNALMEVVPQFPKDFPVPIVLVQHMPTVFTKLLADRLAGQSRISVVEGAAGMPLRAGQAVVAPGGSHMVVERHGTGFRIGINNEPPENSCRPAVDVLFRSVVPLFGGRTLGVILTGMGNDGQRGCELIREAGGEVFVQDEETSVVWGMPGSVARAGLADKVIPLSRIADEIVRRANRSRRPVPMPVAG